MNERTIPSFLPSASGFHFANAWPSGPTVRFGPFDPRIVGVGDAANGLCGGMVYTVGDLLAAGIPMPMDRQPFANGSPRFKAIVRRQVQSLVWLTVPARFYARMAFGGSLGGDRARATLDGEWPKAKAILESGKPAMIGLIRVSSPNPYDLTHNHQVMAWGYAEDGRGATLRLYDPNWPDRDDVTVTIDMDPAFRPTGLRQSTGEPLLGWFVLPYSPADPRAWR